MTGDSGGSPGYTVKDSRWWARPGDEGTASTGESGGSEGAEPGKPTQVAALEGQVVDLDRRLREALARERQAVIELDQARARIERDARKEIERARCDLVVALLPVLDDLDRAIAAAQGGTTSVDALVTGIELVRAGFLDRLRSFGVERFDPTGELFDPTRHEAISTVEARQPGRGGLIAMTLRPGYAAGDEAIRPAQVIVTR